MKTRYFSYKNWSIFTKIFSVAVLILLPMILLFAFKLLPSIEEKLVNEKQRNVKNAVEVAYGVMEKYNDFYKEGKMSLFEAQQVALQTIESMRYEGAEYFWVNNYDLVMKMHPIKKELNEKSVKDNKDPNGKYLFREMVNIVKSDGQGFVDYMWPKPGFEKPVPKTSFVKGFDDWQWLIGSGIYIDDVEAELSAFQNGILLFVVQEGKYGNSIWIGRTNFKSIILMKGCSYLMPFASIYCRLELIPSI